MASPASETSSDTSTDTSTADSASNQGSLSKSNSNTVEPTDYTSHGAQARKRQVDSDSDVSMSADSGDDSDSQDEDDPPKSLTQTQAAFKTQQQESRTLLESRNPRQGSSRKRRFSSSTEIAEDDPHNGTHNEDRKRLRGGPNGQSAHDAPLQDWSLLPAEIWHHIFTFCPPRVLGQLLRVNMSFHSYLGVSANNSIVAQPRSCVKPLNADDIWRVSRKRFVPGAPGPLSKCSELDMWKLACGSLCQFCNKKRQADSRNTKDQWHPGPGENGVSPIWNFGIRACGPCLKEKSLKEVDLLLSSVFFSSLMAALPLIFITNELHVIPTTTLQASQPPPTIQITKHFSKQHVDDISKEFEGVKILGPAAMEEWLKGLDGLGRERKNDAGRWERWEVGGGLVKMRSQDLQDPKAKVEIAPQISSKPIGFPSANGLPPHEPPKLTTQTIQYPPYQGPSVPLQTHGNFLPNPPRFESPAQYGLSQYPPPPQGQPRQPKTKEEVAEIKAIRRAEIERRCMLFDPPLTAGVIAHMSSFQAALQILQPLDERAWKILEPRLLAQREEAEHRENDRLAQTRVAQERLDERRNQESQARSNSKDLVDREWEDIQAPLRARIGSYADETIRDGWNNGEKVNSENCPLFAAEVLIYVRKRFYAEIAKDEAALRATGRQPELDPPNGPSTRKLILENMKWIFDTKIKPLTEPYRKELFLCNDCDFITKYYGFEGIIQHFAAKHTNALSLGSIVVHWKSEWPEHPPFNPDPNSVKPYYGAVPSASVPYTHAAPPTQQPNYGFGGYQPTSAPAVSQAYPAHVYQPSPGPYYGHPQFDPYSGHQNGPYPPPQYPDVSQPYQNTQYSAVPVQAAAGYEAPVDYSNHSYGTQYAAPVQGAYDTSHAQAYPSTYETASQSGFAAQSGQYGPSYNPPASYPAPTYQPATPQITEQYRTQLQQLAQDARDVWNTIHNIKEAPGSVKVYTVIYHILSRFRAMFHEDPSLSMLVDGLSNNKDMRPVRNINGLVCKACSLGMPGSISAPNKKHFSFPQLVNHFHSVHEEGVSQHGAGSIPDWTKDMVELPDHSKLALLASAPGMDEQKLKLFAEALPEITAPPASITSYRNSDEQYYAAEEGSYIDQQPFAELAPSRDNHESYYAVTDNSKPSESDTPHDSGEYDPRNPRDLTVDPQSFRKPSLGNGHSREHDASIDPLPIYRYARQNEEPRRVSYQERPDRSHVEQRPMSLSSQAMYVVGYGRSNVREDAPIYVERPVRYRDEDDVEYRIRQERPIVYEEPGRLYEPRAQTSGKDQAFRSSRQDIQPLSAQESFRPVERLPISGDPVSQQNRIFEVVAQIQQQAKVAQEREHARKENQDAGSEDGEVRAKPIQASSRAVKSLDIADDAAERFLDEFRPNVPHTDIKTEEIEHRRETSRPRWEAREDVYRVESDRRNRREYAGEQLTTSNGRLISMDEPPQDGRMHREPPRQSRAIAYEDRYVSSVPDQSIQRERSPELVDRRYKLNNVVYRDERQSSARRTPSRYARYESARLENDRERSKSPAYVKMGSQPLQYRERSAAPQEPIYRTRSPLPAATDEPVYERQPPRQQEYYRVYADEPRPQYTETFEYVRVADPQGDYMIRRPVRQPVYARYEDEMERQPMYEARDARQEVPAAATGYEEEYDPRHPETVVNADIQRVRYQ